MPTQEGLSLRWQLVVFALSMAAIFSRQPDLLLHAQFFAEDGWVWYQQAYNLDWVRSLGIAQAGYLQTFPRLVAGIALLFPMQHAPLIMNLAGSVIQALPVLALLSRRCVPLGSLPVRMLMVVVYLAIPDAPEVHVVLTNAMWHLALLQALLALSLPPRSWRGRAADLLLFSIGSVTGPFCLLLLPCVGLYWWFRRRAWTLAILGMLSVGAMVQVNAMMHTVRIPGSPLGVTRLRLLRIVGGDIFIDSMLGSGGGNLRLPLLILGAITGLAIVFFGWRSAPLSGRFYSVFALLILVASLRSPLLLPGSTPGWEVLARAMGIRYWFFPSLTFLWLAVWCAFEGKIRLVRFAGVAVLLLSLVGVVRKWSYEPWPRGHFAADVETFNTLKSGDHMTFSVYDPGGRLMELIKR